jgi:tetratricopeptide (TPR) repeat protein
LERRSPDYSNLLKVLSFFDPESISLSMIAEGVADLQLQSAPHAKSPGTILLGGHTDNLNNTSSVSPKLESLIALIQSPVQLQRAIQQLHRLSLVGYKSIIDTSCLRIHDLIQITIQESAERDAQHHWFHVAAALACGAFRHIDNPESYECWAQCETLSPHIQSLTKWDDEHLIGFPDLGQANIKVAYYLRSRGRYGEAETVLARVLTCNEQLLGSGHQDTLQAANNLAIIYRQQGRYKEAVDD